MTPDASSHVIRTRARRSPPSSAARPALLPSALRPFPALPLTSNCGTPAHPHYTARAPARPVLAWPHARERDVPERVVFALRAFALDVRAFALDVRAVARSPALALSNGHAESRLQSPAMGSQWGHGRWPVCAALGGADARYGSASGCDGHGGYVEIPLLQSRVYNVAVHELETVE